MAGDFDPSKREFLKFGAATIGAALLAGSRFDKVFADSTDGKSKRDVYIKEAPWSVSVPVESIGADKRYPRSVNEGGLMKGKTVVNGVEQEYPFRITYNNPVFSDLVTYLYAPQNSGLPQVGDMLPSMYLFKQEENGESLYLKNLAVEMKETEKDSIKLKKGKIYCAIPMVTAGMPSDIVDMGNMVPKGFDIDTNNPIGESVGHLSFALCVMGTRPNVDGSFGLQMLGVVDNSKQGGGLFLDKGNTPDAATVDKYNIGE